MDSWGCPLASAATPEPSWGPAFPVSYPSFPAGLVTSCKSPAPAPARFPSPGPGHSPFPSPRDGHSWTLEDGHSRTMEDGRSGWTQLHHPTLLVPFIPRTIP